MINIYLRFKLLVLTSEIERYYNNLAADYNELRFSNSYGEFIHVQETDVLAKYIGFQKGAVNLDLACGTGRFLDYATYGLDFSTEMLKVAKQKFPDKKFVLGNAKSIPIASEYFDNVICFHLMMHLDMTGFQAVLNEALRVVKREGYFVFDVPSKRRRHISKRKADTWHGSNSMSKKELLAMTAGKWEFVDYHGTIFFPIHRVPKFFRRYLVELDSYFCRSFLKEYSSHLIFILKRI